MRSVILKARPQVTTAFARRRTWLPLSVALSIGTMVFVDGSLQAAERLVPSQYATIQEAISASNTGDHVIVAPGVYAEAIDFLDNAIVVRSAGGPDVTMIDSSGIAGSTVRAVGIPAGFTLEGFTIRGGSSDVGGGLYVLAAPMQLRNCIITDCHADSGAGAYFAANQTVLIDRCRFEGLNSPGAAAVFTGAFTTIIDSTFNENASEEAGGGVIRLFNTGSLHMERCTIADNAMANSAAVSIGGAPASFVDCVFKRNAGRLGGAIVKVGDDVAHFTGCVFYGNTASQGGAVNLNNGGASAIFEQCTFLQNRAITLPLSSGAFGGAIFVTSGALTVRNCEFKANTSVSSGGAINSVGQLPVFIDNCQFIDNHTGVNGGAVRRNGDLTILNSTFSANDATELGDAIHTSEEDADIAIGESWFCGHADQAITGIGWNNLGGVIVQSACTTPADITGDGVVNVEDLLVVIAQWGACRPAMPCPADLNADENVDIEDLVLVLSNWG